MYDISVPPEEIPAFLPALTALLQQEHPGIADAVFGHVADGNLHVYLLKPAQLAAADFAARCAVIDEQVFALIQRFAGSIAAEHGVGLLKKNVLHYSRSALEVAHMRQLKRVFDPRGILNPGKIFNNAPE